MEISIAKTVLAASVTGREMFLPHQSAKVRMARVMLWTHLVRDRGFSYGQIAKRFACSRRNVIWAVRNFEDSMEVQRQWREKYRAFKEKAGLTNRPTPLRL